MLDAIREGGWPIYLVMAFGAASLGFSIRYSREGKKELLAPAVGLTIAALLCGLFGTVAGFMISVEHIREVPDNQRWIVLIGLKESLNNLGMALVLALGSTLLITRGAWRRARLEP
jgi:hypothetical protein